MVIIVMKHALSFSYERSGCWIQLMAQMHHKTQIQLGQHSSGNPIKISPTQRNSHICFHPRGNPHFSAGLCFVYDFVTNISSGRATDLKAVSNMHAVRRLLATRTSPYFTPARFISSFAYTSYTATTVTDRVADRTKQPAVQRHCKTSQ